MRGTERRAPLVAAAIAASMGPSSSAPGMPISSSIAASTAESRSRTVQRSGVGSRVSRPGSSAVSVDGRSSD